MKANVDNVLLHMRDVVQHKTNVSKFANIIAKALLNKCAEHDNSKFSEEEIHLFSEVTPSLKSLTYNSDEYREKLSLLGPALTHHYENNDHHPEYHKNGIQDMDLVTLIEMLCDWNAAAMRHSDGDILKSMEINKKRFNIDEQLYSVLMNTVKNYL